MPVLILIFTLLTSLALLYSIYTNPEFVLGSRATVQYKSGSGEFTGNPHVYSRNGLAGFIISMLLIFHSGYKNKLNEIADLGGTKEIITRITKRVNGGTHGLDSRISYFNKFFKKLN
jgi:hypothetical protein